MHRMVTDSELIRKSVAQTMRARLLLEKQRILNQSATESQPGDDVRYCSRELLSHSHKPRAQDEGVSQVLQDVINTIRADMQA
jgi:hypothetical protein